MAAIYANNMKENAMQKDALTYLRFVNQKKRKTYYGCTEILHFQVNYCTIYCLLSSCSDSFIFKLLRQSYMSST